MVSSPLTRSEQADLPCGCRPVGSALGSKTIAQRLIPWTTDALKPDLQLVLAATRTAEHPGISAAGCTPEARRITALADAELLLRGPRAARRWTLPPLPAGVSPALLSWVVVEALALNPHVVALGLPLPADFPHLRLESASFGPAQCLSSGRAMSVERVMRLRQQGERQGCRLQHPLVLAECVPGGTTTAQAVLAALGMGVDGLISGSARLLPHRLKADLVALGRKRSHLEPSACADQVLAALGDPFQAYAFGLLVGAAHSSTPVPLLLGGGSQMIAVLALALRALPVDQRARLSQQTVVGTTAWLAGETGLDGAETLPRLVDTVSEHCGTPIAVVASGVRFNGSRHQALRDFEDGYVKEGVGAGALLLLAQLQGIALDSLVQHCDRAMDGLVSPPVGSDA